MYVLLTSDEYFIAKVKSVIKKTVEYCKRNSNKNDMNKKNDISKNQI